MYKRAQKFSGGGNESLFLWGARQTGKSTLLKMLFKDALVFDLLLADVYERFQRNAAQLREIVLASNPDRLVIIDEIQRIPALLNEVHWLMVNQNTGLSYAGQVREKF